MLADAAEARSGPARPSARGRPVPGTVPRDASGTSDAFEQQFCANSLHSAGFARSQAYRGRHASPSLVRRSRRTASGTPTTRGVERQAVYLDRDDGRAFLAQLWRAVDRFRLDVYALCLMPNHYHFVVECSRDLLSRALHRVNGLYAEAFNAKYRRSGHLWGDRFALWQVRDEEHLEATCAYVLREPGPRRALLDAPTDWPWSWSRYARAAASSVISGTPASACETGQSSFASSAASRNAVRVQSRAPRPRTVERDLRDPRPRDERDRRRRRSRSGGVPALARPLRERHREAGRVRRRDQLLRARLAARRLLRRAPPSSRRAARTRPSRPRRSCPTRSSGRPSTSPLRGARPPCRSPPSSLRARRAR